MPTLIPGFEYDIFISYRHNENRNNILTNVVDPSSIELSIIDV